MKTYCYWWLDGIDEWELYGHPNRVLAEGDRERDARMGCHPSEVFEVDLPDPPLGVREALQRAEDERAAQWDREHAE